MLARLNQIDGVQSSSASLETEGGALVRVDVRPGADPARIAADVRRTLSDAVKDRSPVQLSSQAAAALQQKEWLDQTQLAEVATTDAGTSEGRGPGLLAALLLAALVVALGLLAWRRLSSRRAGPSRPQPRLSQSP